MTKQNIHPKRRTSIFPASTKTSGCQGKHFDAKAFILMVTREPIRCPDLQGLLVQTCDPRYWVAEAGGSPIPWQLGLQNKFTDSQDNLVRPCESQWKGNHPSQFSVLLQSITNYMAYTQQNLFLVILSECWKSKIRMLAWLVSGLKLWRADLTLYSYMAGREMENHVKIAF